MSTFIEKTDYKTQLRDQRLDQIIDQDNTILDEAEETAIQIVKDHLYQLYDTDTIFAATGSARKRNVLRWCICLSIYFLYERIPDSMVPERVIKNYDDTLEMLKRVAKGQPALDLPEKVNEDSEPLTRFRGGSEIRRSHGNDYTNTDPNLV